MKNDIQGEARIPLQTFLDLREESENKLQEAKQMEEQHKDALQMLGDFLQFLGTKQYFDDIKEEFNASHNRLSINRDSKDQRIKIYLDGEKIQRQDKQD